MAMFLFHLLDSPPPQDFRISQLDLIFQLNFISKNLEKQLELNIPTQLAIQVKLVIRAILVWLASAMLRFGVAY
jgi:hypothetical protein